MTRNNISFDEMTPAAQTIVEFYDIAHFSSRNTSFYKKKLPPFYKKKLPPYKKLQPLISAFIKNSFLEIIETPDLIARTSQAAEPIQINSIVQ